MDQDTARVGFRYSSSPRSNFIGSAIYNDLHEDVNLPFFDLRLTSSTQGVYEGEYLLDGDFFNVSTGLSIFDVQDSLRFRRESSTSVTNQETGFAYTNIHFPRDVTWTLGLSYDDFEEENIHFQEVNPKIGLQWNVTPALRLRLAAFRTIKPPLVANRTIQPTQVAGFNQFFDDAAGTEAWQYGAGLDSRMTEKLTAGIEASKRDLSVPLRFVSGEGVRLRREHADESLYRAYLYWTPYLEWAVGGELRFDYYSREKGAATSAPKQVQTLSAPLCPLFSSAGLLRRHYRHPLHQDVRRQQGSGPQGEDTFFLVDAAVGYRFPQRLGLASLEVRNLFNSDFKYQDDSFRESREAPPVSRFVPKRVFFGRLTFSF